jgi:hypothetical protein
MRADVYIHIGSSNQEGRYLFDYDSNAGKNGTIIYIMYR